jgi:hypothetical protein
MAKVTGEYFQQGTVSEVEKKTVIDKVTQIMQQNNIQTNDQYSIEYIREFILSTTKKTINNHQDTLKMDKGHQQQFLKSSGKKSTTDTTTKHKTNSNHLRLEL